MTTMETTMIRQAPAQPADSRPARVNGWVVLGVLLGLVTIGWGAYNLISLLAHAETDQHRSMPSAGVHAVRVSTNDGSIVLTTGPAGSDIVVDDRLSEGLHAPTSKIEIIDGRASITGHCSAWSQYWCSVSYRVQVPAGVAVELVTDNGDVTVDGVSGSLTVRTDLGKIQATHLTAAVVDTGADVGATKLEFDRPPEQVTARTDVGSITVVVPADETVYAVELANDIGSKSNEVRHDSTSSRRISARADVGSVTVRYPD